MSKLTSENQIDQLPKAFLLVSDFKALPSLYEDIGWDDGEKWIEYFLHENDLLNCKTPPFLHSAYHASSATDMAAGCSSTTFVEATISLCFYPLGTRQNLIWPFL